MDRGNVKARRKRSQKLPIKELMVTSRDVCTGHPRNVAGHSYLDSLDPAETSLNIPHEIRRQGTA